MGGDPVTCEPGIQDSFDSRPFSRLVFSANSLPQSKDGSHGFFRRWLVVPFNRTFTAEDEIDQTTLDAMLSAPGEQSGLLNKALDALRRLNRQRCFTVPESVLLAIEEFRATTDPLAVWLDQNTIEDPDSVVPCDALLTAFNSHAKDNGIPSMSRTAFGAAVKRMRPGRLQATDSRPEVVWCYIGIGNSDD